MSSYTVQAVNSNREWEGKFGKMISYDINLQGPEGFTGSVELAQKPETPAPQEGGTLEGHIEQGKFGPKFKKESGQTFKGGGGGKPKADQDSIERSVAYKGAVDIACALITAGNPSEAEVRATIENFFDHGLALVQGKRLTTPEQAFPGAVEVGPTAQELVAAYKDWMATVPDADEAKRDLALEKTAIGIVGDTDSATDEQKAKLLNWFREQS